MKKRVLVGMTALLLSISLLMAQEIPAGVITAFKRGSSQELSKYMGGKVNLVLQGRSTNVDKQKATAMMQDFFTENKVSGFNVNHQGKRDESSFVIGTLTTHYWYIGYYQRKLPCKLLPEESGESIFNTSNKN